MIARSLASLVVQAAGAATSFGLQVLLTRLLGSANTGVYTANTTSHTLAVAKVVAVDALAGKRWLDHGDAVPLLLLVGWQHHV